MWSIFLQTISLFYTGTLKSIVGFNSINIAIFSVFNGGYVGSAQIEETRQNATIYRK